MPLLKGALVLVLVMAAVPASATVPLPDLVPTPEAFDGDHDRASRTVNLTWNATGLANASFQVYRNGEVIANVTTTYHVANVTGPIDVFQVRARTDDGESAPTEPYSVVDVPVMCPILAVSIQPPGYNIDERCIENLIETTMPLPGVRERLG